MAITADLSDYKVFGQSPPGDNPAHALCCHPRSCQEGYPLWYHRHHKGFCVIAWNAT